MSKHLGLTTAAVFSLCLAVGAILLYTDCAKSQVTDATTVNGPPRVDHILLDVSKMDASIAFYRDMIGLRPKSLSSSFSILEAENLGVYLSISRRPWEVNQSKERGLGAGIYPHFEVADVRGLVDKLRKNGYKIVQEAEDYAWGTEAFVADPDGYIWALFKWRKKR